MLHGSNYGGTVTGGPRNTGFEQQSKHGRLALDQNSKPSLVPENKDYAQLPPVSVNAPHLIRARDGIGAFAVTYSRRSAAFQ